MVNVFIFNLSQQKLILPVKVYAFTLFSRRLFNDLQLLEPICYSDGLNSLNITFVTLNERG